MAPSASRLKPGFHRRLAFRSASRVRAGHSKTGRGLPRPHFACRCAPLEYRDAAWQWTRHDKLEGANRAQLPYLNRKTGRSYKRCSIRPATPFTRRGVITRMVMLILSRKTNESIVIDGRILVKIV